MRIIPKIRFVNYHKAFPMAKGLWKDWFKIEKYWSGKIIQIYIRQYCICLDFRKNWIADMFPKKEVKP